MWKRTSVFLFIAALLFMFSPIHASAQLLEEDEEAYVYKGFFVGAEYGAYILALKPSTLAKEGGAQSATFGSIAGIELGYDISQSFSLQLSFINTQLRGDAQKGGGNGTLLFNLGASIFFVRTGRMFVYAKLGAGLMMVVPSELLPTGVMAHAGFGIRYFTRLRHFSFGIEVLGLFRPPLTEEGMALGIGVLPTLTYTFGAPATRN